MAKSGGMMRQGTYQSLRKLSLVGLAVSLALSLSVVSARASTWTVLMYMAADNDLWEEALGDLAELEEVGSTSEVRVLVQADIRGSRTGRLLVQRGSSRLLRDLGHVDSGDPEVLAEFGIWGILRYPSEHHMLIIWDHGNGWFNSIGGAGSTPSQAPPPVTAGIGYDGTSGNSIGVANGELSGALARIASHLGRAVDVLGLDACSMQLLEVAYEVKDAARILVGSEGLVPLDGWPYDNILGLLTANPALRPEELATAIVQTYVESYDNGSQGISQVTLSALDLARMEQVRDRLEGFSGLLMGRADQPFVQTAREQVQSFCTGIVPPFVAHDYIDLAHFAQLIRDRSSGEMWESASSLAGATISSVICSRHIGDSLRDAQGLAIWYPEQYLAFVNSHLDYKDLGLASTTSWEEFVYRSYGVPDTIAPTTPELVTTGLVSANSFMVRWKESYDLSGAHSYELRELSGLSSPLSDDCEGPSDSWVLQGFVQSEGNYHSPSHAYFSHDGEMATREPLYLTAGGELSFWCSYRGRQGSDFLLIEVSQDGLDWQPVDSLTGTEAAWIRRKYDLSRHAVVGIYIRLRYDSDGAPERWVYLDDLEVVNFGTSATLSDNIESNFFPVLGRARGEYYYQVRAMDPYGNRSPWSDYGFAYVPGLEVPYNYPNPFGAGGTTIQFVVSDPQFSSLGGFCSRGACASGTASGGPVSVRVYDSSGRLVKTLLENEPVTDGQIPMTIYWDGRDGMSQQVPSGTYLYRLDTGSVEKTGKAICIK